MRNDLERMMAGYHGEDSMRDKAKRMFAGELKGNMNPPQSYSSRGREKMRFYAEGGSVEDGDKMKRGGHRRKHHSRHHALSHDQRDLHLPKRAKTPRLNIEKFSEADHMKRGGHRHKKHCMNEGGLLGQNPATWSPAEARRGGKMHHPMKHRMQHHAMHHPRHLKHKYADGGSLTDTMDQYFKPIARFAPNKLMPYIGKAYNAAREYAPRMKGFYDTAKKYAPMAQQAISSFSPRLGEGFGRFRSAFGLKKGGKAHKPHHRNHHYSHGGDVYEHEMVGEHPSHHPHHFNYEHEMMGEHDVRSPRGPRIRHPHVDDESHHQNFAMGGVGKIRHKQADRFGHQIMRRVRKGR